MAGQGARAGVEPVLGPGETARPAEAAAVTAAIARYLAKRRRAAGADDADPERPGRAWGFAGRLDRQDSRVVRVPAGAPGDPWSVAGRADRL